MKIKIYRTLDLGWTYRFLDKNVLVKKQDTFTWYFLFLVVGNPMGEVSFEWAPVNAVTRSSVPGMIEDFLQDIRIQQSAVHIFGKY